MAKGRHPQYVDILIPSKDRTTQLHLLLESMGKHLKGMGRVTISWMGSSDDFIAGYNLLRKRVMNDEAFGALRENSKEIVFKQRNTLREVYDAATESGDSYYIMPLIDEDIFFKDYDLVNAAPSIYFFEHPSVISCSLRLGNNLSNQLPSTTDDGLLAKEPCGHATSLLSSGAPRYIQNKYTHKLGDINNEDSTTCCLIWAWPDNMNVIHWNIAWSTTSHIYRKSDYLDMMQRVGRENFLLIEGMGAMEHFRKFLQLPSPLFNMLRLADRVQAKLLKRYGIYEQDILQTILAKVLYRKRLKQKKDFAVPIYMVAAQESVVVNLDVGTSHHRKGGFGQDVLSLFNQKYLLGNVISLSTIPFNKIKFPVHVYEGFDFIPY